VRAVRVPGSRHPASGIRHRPDADPAAQGSVGAAADAEDDGRTEDRADGWAEVDGRLEVVGSDKRPALLSPAGPPADREALDDGTDDRTDDRVAEDGLADPGADA
jgi:hypothetical protein